MFSVANKMAQLKKKRFHLIVAEGQLPLVDCDIQKETLFLLCTESFTKRHKVHKEIYFQVREQSEETYFVISLSVEVTEKDISRKKNCQQ